MKCYLLPSIVLAIAVCVPAAAAQESDTTTQVTVQMLNTAGPQVFVSPSGLLISPRPQDPNLERIWEATQSWIGDNIDKLGPLVNQWQMEARGDESVNRMTYVNQQLQGYLDESDASSRIFERSASSVYQ